MNKLELWLNFSKEFITDSKYENINPRIFKVLIDLNSSLSQDLIADYDYLYYKYYFNDIFKFNYLVISSFLKKNSYIIDKIKTNKSSTNIMNCKDELFKGKKNINKKANYTKLSSLIFEMKLMISELSTRIYTVKKVQFLIKNNIKNQVTNKNPNKYFFSDLKSKIELIILLSKSYHKNKLNLSENLKKFYLRLYIIINKNYELKALIRLHKIIKSINNWLININSISFNLYEYKLYDNIDVNGSFNTNKNNQTSSFTFKESSFKNVHSYWKSKNSFKNNFNESKVMHKESYNNQSFKKNLDEIIIELDSKVDGEGDSVNNNILKDEIQKIKKLPPNKKNKKIDNYYCKCNIF